MRIIGEMNKANADMKDPPAVKILLRFGPEVDPCGTSDIFGRKSKN